MKKRVTFIALEPSEGYWLTQVTLENESERVFSELVYCPTSEEDNWQEVDEAYKTEWEEAQHNESE